METLAQKLAKIFTAYVVEALSIGVMAKPAHQGTQYGIQKDLHTDIIIVTATKNNGTDSEALNKIQEKMDELLRKEGFPTGFLRQELQYGKLVVDIPVLKTLHKKDGTCPSAQEILDIEKMLHRIVNSLWTGPAATFEGNGSDAKGPAERIYGPNDPVPPGDQTCIFTLER